MHFCYTCSWYSEDLRKTCDIWWTKNTRCFSICLQVSFLFLLSTNISCLSSAKHSSLVAKDINFSWHKSMAEYISWEEKSIYAVAEIHSQAFILSYGNNALEMDSISCLSILGNKLMVLYNHESTWILQLYDSDAFLHHDEYLMPKVRAAWGSRNFLETTNGTTFITYWMNNLQVCNKKQFLALS